MPGSGLSESCSRWMVSIFLKRVKKTIPNVAISQEKRRWQIVDAHGNSIYGA